MWRHLTSWWLKKTSSSSVLKYYHEPSPGTEFFARGPHHGDNGDRSSSFKNLNSATDRSWQQFTECNDNLVGSLFIGVLGCVARLLFFVFFFANCRLEMMINIRFIGQWPPHGCIFSAYPVLGENLHWLLRHIWTGNLRNATGCIFFFKENDMVI